MMRKPVAEMTEREMLEELVSEKRRNDVIRLVLLGICAAAAVIVIVLLAIYLPPVIAFFRQLNESIQQVQGEFQKIQEAIDSVRETVSGIGSAGKETLESAVEQITDLLGRITGFFR